MLKRFKVYQIVRKFIDEQSQYQQSTAVLSTSVIYSYIKQSKSSLNRKNKRLLEDSIEKVISFVSDARENDEATSGAESDVVDDAPFPHSNTMNKSLIGRWSNQTADRASSQDVRGSILPAAPSSLEEDLAPSKDLQYSLSARPSKKRPATFDRNLSSKRHKESKKLANNYPNSEVNLADLGGVDSIITELTELIALPMLYPGVYTSSGIQPPRGVLLHGPPGCGKTMIANAFASELGVSFISLSAPSIVSGMSGESEKKLRDYFEEARNMAPCLMFIDEIDAITPKRESAQREMEKRIVAQMLTCLDDISLEKTRGKAVIVLAATNRPDSLDPALRRAGRFNKEINLQVPNEAAREQILHALTQKLKLEEGVNFKEIAKQTAGFVGADLSDLVSTAGVIAANRVFEMIREEVDSRTIEDSVDTAHDASQPSVNAVTPALDMLRRLISRSEQPSSFSSSSTLCLIASDFSMAFPKVQPSSKREGFATIPDTTWADIGALHQVRDELTMAIVEPIARPERYAALGITAPTGVLLWGPPGCGKTLLAKAVANESRASFISIKGPELLNKYVGESERAVRQVFLRARASVPCVVFFDELDALVPKRNSDGLSEASARVVNTLLTELDGLNDRKGIFVIAATNRPDIIDPAMLRPGRLGTLLFVDLPGPEERGEILKTLVKTQTSVDLDAIARQCEGFSGADLENLLRAAGVAALRRNGNSLEQNDFNEAMAKVQRSVVDIERYRRLRGRREWG